VIEDLVFDGFPKPARLDRELALSAAGERELLSEAEFEYIVLPAQRMLGGAQQ
jgi:hypothetical protein